MNCSACFSIIVNDEDYLCCSKCSKTYHVMCVGEQKIANTSNLTWICPECICSNKKGGDNSFTQIGISQVNRDTNVTLRQKTMSTSYAKDTESQDKLELTHELRELRSEMSKIKEELCHSTSLIASYETKISQSVIIIEKYDAKLSKCLSVIENYESKMGKYEGLLESLRKTNTFKNPSIEVFSNTPSYLSTSVQTSSTTVQTKSSPVNLQAMSISAPSTKPQKEPGKEHTATVIIDDQQNIKRRRKKRGKYGIAKHTQSQSSCQTEPPSISTNLNEPNIDNDSQSWTEVRKRKSLRPTSIQCTAGPSITSLKAVEARKFLHLWNMASSAEEIRKYLRTLCPTSLCTVEEIVAKGDYKSYKIGVPLAAYNTCYSEHVWPVNARIKDWINYKNRTKRNYSEQTQSNQPFRGQPSQRA